MFHKCFLWNWIYIYMYIYALQKLWYFKSLTFRLQKKLYEFEIISTFWLQRQGGPHCSTYLASTYLRWKMDGLGNGYKLFPTPFATHIIWIDIFLVFHTEEYIFGKEYAYIYVWRKNIGIVFFALKIL